MFRCSSASGRVLFSLPEHCRGGRTGRSCSSHLPADPLHPEHDPWNSGGLQVCLISVLVSDYVLKSFCLCQHLTPQSNKWLWYFSSSSSETPVTETSSTFRSRWFDSFTSSWYKPTQTIHLCGSDLKCSYVLKCSKYIMTNTICHLLCVFLPEWDPQSDREILCEWVSGGGDWEAERGEPKTEGQLLIQPETDPAQQLLCPELSLSGSAFSQTVSLPQQGPV